MPLPLIVYPLPLQDCLFFTTLFSIPPYRHHPTAIPLIKFYSSNVSIVWFYKYINHFFCIQAAVPPSQLQTTLLPPPPLLKTPPLIPMPQLPLITQYHRIRKAYIGRFFSNQLPEYGKQVPLTVPGGGGSYSSYTLS